MSDALCEIDVVEAQAVVPAPRLELAELFWDIGAWHAIWQKIDTVDVLYDDGVHQEFVMGVHRDRRREDVRTIRYRRDDGDIDFFSPRPPPTMTAHVGRWGFRAEPAQPASCRVAARREYHLIRGAGEAEARYRQRRREYGERFSHRLQAILDCFAEHYANRRHPTPEEAS